MRYAPGTLTGELVRLLVGQIGISCFSGTLTICSRHPSENVILVGVDHRGCLDDLYSLFSESRGEQLVIPIVSAMDPQIRDLRGQGSVDNRSYKVVMLQAL